MDTADLVWGVLFGAVGLGYFIYGRKQRHTVAFIAGMGLMGLPYFVSGALWLLLLGAMLMAAPFVVKV